MKVSPLKTWLHSMPTRAVLAEDFRQLLKAPPIVQSAYLGDDPVERQRKIDSLAVFVAAYDYAVATIRRRLDNVAQLPPQPKCPLLAPAGDDDDDDAPSLETVLYLRYLAYSLDIDSLDEMDAVDLEQERDWCDYWYSWYAAQLDAS